ncbi:Putative NACHT nucleoside triphosphatase, P-loop containing nucleoside triphosphate hydrolase [Colletotrichum destructivum]|uniref:NACHT nucleoside triphosphatase, P-loop containing nucleoside triphosphate hydrolase n=1 Tax=Colletotrichum destructivum TaxID=34406 RepID=A0AAX4J076_9PEZI|nr:Putative NACHT nucleoside triphosphatase, P-loop containing nucleoside triphosphate hydrolase [Colletotrichum destructivum]
MAYPTSAFSRAVREFADKSTKKKVPSFIKGYLEGTPLSSVEEIHHSVLELEKQCSQRVPRRRLRPLITVLKDYDGVISTLCQADPMPSALIWGGLKAVMECIHRYDSLFEKIETQLKSLTRQMKRLKDYEKLFPESEEMQELLVSSYIGIIKFWARVEEQCSTSSLLLAGKALASFSTKRLDEILAEMSEDCDCIGKLVPIIQEHIRRGEQADATIERQRAGIVLEQVLRNQAQAREENRRREVREWVTRHDSLNVSNHRLQTRLRERHHTGTGAWLSHNIKFVRWLRPESGSKVLWLVGGSGVGKSVLCAHMIENLRSQEPNSLIAFHYFSFDEPQQPLEIYQNIADQLCFQLYGPNSKEEVSDHISEAIQGILDVPSLQNLIRVLVSESKSTYIFLDGLDEEYSDKGRFSSATKAVSFFKKIATQDLSGLKLWCSSQDRRKIRDMFDNSEVINLTSADNDGDIEAFLSSSLNSDDFEDVELKTKAELLTHLRIQVHGNFLWAAMMVESMEVATSTREVWNAIRKGLPEDFEKFLEKRVQAYKPTHHTFISNVFSCIVYARRPLTLPELCEAVETSSLNTGEDMHPDCRVFRGKLLDICAPLVRIDTIPDSSSEKEVCTLSHSSVRVFLMDNPSILARHIAPDIMALGCLQYLQQPRLRCLMTETERLLKTQTNDSSMGQYLLQYAAQYWDSHLDDLPYSHHLCQVVEKFVKSHHFRLVLKVLAINGSPKLVPPGIELMRDITAKNLPHWFIEQYPSGQALDEQLRYALREWFIPLMLENFRLSEYPGQIDRCLWSTLPRNNFLHRAPCSSKAFILEKSDFGGLYATDSVYQRTNSQGTEVDVFILNRHDEDGSAASVLCERWTMSPVPRRPKLKHQKKIQVPSDCLRFYPSEVGNQNNTRVNAIEGTEDGRLLRIGSHICHSPLSADSDLTLANAPGNAMNYIEEIASNGLYYAVATRRQGIEDSFAVTPPESKCVVERETPHSHHRQASGRTESKERSTSNSSQSEASSNSAYCNEEEEALNSSSDADHESHLSRLLSDDDMGDSPPEIEDSNVSSPSLSACESWSEGSTEDISDEIDEALIWDGQDPSDNGRSVCDEVGDSTQSSASSEDGYNTSPGSTSSEKSSRPSIRSHISSVRDVSARDSPGASDRTDSSSDYEPSCNESDIFDILEDVMKTKIKDFLAPEQPRDKQQSLMEIRILPFSPKDVNATGQVFRYACHSDRITLYDSPPVFHPTEKLAVWPLGNEEVLFADFGRNKYFVRRLQTQYHTGCQVSMQCRFSACGQYLHAASLVGTVAGNKTHGEALSLTLHISTWRLSSSKPTRSPPRLVYRIVRPIPAIYAKEWKLSLSSIPYTLNWMASYVFVSSSSFKLRVCRVPLFKKVEQNGEAYSSKAAVLTDGLVCIPLSATSRKIFFFANPDENPRKYDSKKGGNVLHTNSKQTKKSVSAHVILSAVNMIDAGARIGLDKVLFSKESIESTPPQVLYLDLEALVWENDDMEFQSNWKSKSGRMDIIESSIAAAMTRDYEERQEFMKGNQAGK